jgi:hypothetical protein
MLNIADHAALAAAGIGLAVMTVPPAAACFIPVYACAGSVLVTYRPVIRRAVCGYVHWPIYRYTYAVPRYRVYQLMAFRIARPAAFGKAASHHRYRSHRTAPGSHPGGAAANAETGQNVFGPPYRSVYADK